MRVLLITLLITFVTQVKAETVTFKCFDPELGITDGYFQLVLDNIDQTAQYGGWSEVDVSFWRDEFIAWHHISEKTSKLMLQMLFNRKSSELVISSVSLLESEKPRTRTSVDQCVRPF